MQIKCCQNQSIAKPVTLCQVSSTVQQPPLDLLSHTSPDGQHLFSVLLVHLLLVLDLANLPSAQ